MRLFRALVCSSVMVACGSDAGGDGSGASGNSGPDFEVSTTNLSGTLGAPFSLTYNTAPFQTVGTCFAPSSDGALFQAKMQNGYHTYDLVKTKPNAATPLWSVTLAFDDTYRALADAGTGSVCTLVPTPDGGAALVANLVPGGANSAVRIGVTLVGISPEGKQRFSKVVKTDLAGGGGVTALPSGTIVMPLAITSGAFTVGQTPTTLHGFDPIDGHELFSTELPPAVVPGVGDGVTIGIANSGYYPPDHGVPSVQKIAPTADGGFAAIGVWGFAEEIECGTEDNPQVPSERSCSLGNDDAMVARFDPSGKLRWTVRIGAPYGTPDRSIVSGVELADGSILGIGTGPDTHGIPPDPAMRALAFRIDPNGQPIWAKAFVWSTPPGEHFTAGGTTFIAAVPAGGGARIVVAPPERARMSCPLVELDANGAITRAGTVPVASCAGAAFGNQLFVSGASGVALVAP